MTKRRNLEYRIFKQKTYIEEELKKIFITLKAPKILKDVMRYSVLNGGKRIRPFLLAEVSKIYNVKPSVFKYPCMAVEIIHSFSLVYDDLPCMDDDKLRRGKPTVHIAFNEANALLGGSSLLIYAFELLSYDKFKVNNDIKVNLINKLSKAIGSDGMLAGQFLDLQAESQNFHLTLQKFKRIQEKKTSLLIALCSYVGAKLGNASKKEISTFYNFGILLGKIFQIKDDILDLEGSKKNMGKEVRKDKKSNKATIIRLKNIDYAKNEIIRLGVRAKNELSKIKKNTRTLNDFVDYLLTRTN